MIPAGLCHHVYDWARAHPFEPTEVDCATAVMLKILDGKCKMKPESMVVMELLYDSVKQHPGNLLDDEIHKLITTARYRMTEALRLEVYEKRLLAETMISRPVMKAFKAMLRNEGLFDSPDLIALKSALEDAAD